MHQKCEKWLTAEKVVLITRKHWIQHIIFATETNAADTHTA